MILTRRRGGLSYLFLRVSASPRDGLQRCFQGGRLKSVHQLAGRPAEAGTPAYGSGEPCYYMDVSFLITGEGE